ncbi:L,D-transpeptidase family protein [Chryseolinea lacunae]|uniref:L,D-transpeptidase family protein n=1 Tax=Chryseolinea lacunae TaxID=2801331 RepID=A0ABS1KNB9_9BACT|nr:L,D-transpeptidase family protein [Chryseolinea lacunae]MBL0740955.1 L,D-transpeptidase family protein [Chryseolinea lacunae]
MKTFPLLLLFFVACCWGCRQTAQVSDQIGADSIRQKKMLDAQLVAGNFSDQKAVHFDSSAIRSFVKKYPGFASYGADLEKFYRARNYSYAWYDRNGVIEQASALFNRIQNLQQDGIKATLPYTQNFQALMDDRDTLLRREPMNAEAELMLTSQYFSFARHVWHGIDESETRKLEWFLPRKKLDLDALMDSLLNPTSKPFVTHEPVYRQYALLKSYLKKYNDIESRGGWKTITLDRKAYHKGDSSMVVVELRKRLFASGDYAGDTTSTLFTDDLEAAVKIFQESRGATPDGIVGSGMVKDLNVPVAEIIQKIVVNMERCRWVPQSMDGDYMVVNIPSFKLYVYHADSLVWDMNVVAGQAIHQTNIFSGDLKYIVFSPYWNVPASILKNEVMPGIEADPDYLAKHNMEKVGNTVRQKPGPRNSLGLVKFLFPNSYSIYLHDTPSKSLFGKDNRAFSHGCVRLAEPKKLAMYLLRNNPEWTEAKIDAAMNAGKEKYVTLDKTVPVLLAYLTAFVGRDGRLNVRNDVYNLDARLAKMMLQ